MRKHAASIQNSVRKDRKKGQTISQLMAKYSLPKTTVWYYIQGVTPTKQGAALIRSARGGNTIRRNMRWTDAQQKADLLLSDFKEGDAWPVLLAALYWAEGTKKEFVFTNTSESMVRVYLILIRKYLNIPNESIQILVRICNPMKPEVCRKYWSKITGVPAKNIGVNFHNSYNKSTTVYGMCRISVRKGGNYLKLIHCLIRALTAKMLLSVKPL